MTTFLLELKERWSRLYDRHEKKILFIFKFAFSLIALFLLTNEIGFLTVLKNPLVIIPSAAVCAFTPGFVTVIVLSVFVFMHLFSVSLQLALVVMAVMLVMYLLFFRFCPKAIYVLLLVIFCFCLRIEYVLPVCLALMLSFNYIFAVDFGIVLFYIFHTIGAYEAVLTRQTSVDKAGVISYLAESILNNRAMIAVLICFSVTFLLVNIVRRRPISYARAYSIIAGVVSQLILLIVMDIWLGAGLHLPAVIAGTIVSTGIAFIFNVMFFGADFTRQEHLQFEDDEYFYYVKAVPKRNVTVSDVKVTHINAKSLKDRGTTEFTPVDWPDDDNADK